MTGIEFIAALKRAFHVHTDRALLNHLGRSQVNLFHRKRSKSISARQIAGLVAGAAKTSERRVQKEAIRPIVEFFPISRTVSAQGKSFELFDSKGNGKPKKFLAGLRDELEAHRGVYIFFDSRGQAVYAGRARKQSLWSEMKGAFNRKRDGLQGIKRVPHPTRNQAYKTGKEKSRQIREVSIPLHEMAHYFSAYEVAEGMIDELEALLVRSFANNLLNKRMERFGQQRSAAR